MRKYDYEERKNTKFNKKKTGKTTWEFDTL